MEAQVKAVDRLDLGIARAAIVASPRGAVLDHLALERFTNIATQVDGILAEVPAARRLATLTLAGRLWKRSADLVAGFQYHSAYQVLDRIPAVLRRQISALGRGENERRYASGTGEFY